MSINRRMEKLWYVHTKYYSAVWKKQGKKKAHTIWFPLHKILARAKPIYSYSNISVIDCLGVRSGRMSDCKGFVGDDMLYTAIVVVDTCMYVCQNSLKFTFKIDAFLFVNYVSINSMKEKMAQKFISLLSL